MPGNLKQQALSAAMVRTVNRPGMYADGNGLNLKVVSSGAKRWSSGSPSAESATTWGWVATRRCPGEARELAAEISGPSARAGTP